MYLGWHGARAALHCCGGGNRTAEHPRDIPQTRPELREGNHTNNNKINGASVFYSNGLKCCFRDGSTSCADMAPLGQVESLLTFILLIDSGLAIINTKCPQLVHENPGFCLVQRTSSINALGLKGAQHHTAWGPRPVFNYISLY